MKEWQLLPSYKEESSQELIISITGSLKGYTMPLNIKKVFENDLKVIVKKIKNALLITSGTDSGVMKLVGEALKDISSKNLLGVVDYRSCRRVYF